MTDPRYPCTYACDYIRGFGPVQYGEGVVLSRADASQILQGIAKALNMDDHQLACKLADAFLEQQDDPEHQERQQKRLLAALGISPTSLTH